MAMTTFLTESEIEAYSRVAHKDLNDLFQEIRKLIGKKYLLHEREVDEYRGLFRKRKRRTVYTLYINLGFTDKTLK